MVKNSVFEVNGIIHRKYPAKEDQMINLKVSKEGAQCKTAAAANE